MDDDRRLVAAARKGDRAAFRTLVERHQRRVFAVALALLKNREDALDIVQETFLRAHRGLEGFDGESQLFTWLYRIAHNLCIDHLRRRRFETVQLDERIEVADERDHLDTDPVRNIMNDELRGKILAALDKLTPAHREVLMLREVEGLSYKEIADATDCNIGTVMSRLFHARKNLERHLRDADPRALDLAA
jgi:RNA polymerase sigma-70 factor (ECF subfamily)